MRHLKQQQKGLESRMQRLSGEHEHCTRRLDAVEATLKAIGCRESDLAEEAAETRGRRIGQRNLTLTALPLAAVFLAWLLGVVWMAVRHAAFEEGEWQLQQKRPPPMQPPTQISPQTPTKPQ